MREFSECTSAVRMKALVKWSTAPWGEGPLSSKDHPSRYKVKREFEIDACSMPLEEFMEKWGILYISELHVGVPGINRLTGKPLPLPNFANLPGIGEYKFDGHM